MVAYDNNYQVRKQDWKTEPMPIENILTVPIFSWITPPGRESFHTLLSKKNLEILKRGHIPSCSEDSWFIYSEGDKIYFHRAWTGYCVYILDIPKETDPESSMRLTVNNNFTQVFFDEPDWEMKEFYKYRGKHL